MTSDTELDLLGAIVTRFGDDYFIRDLAVNVLFCIPNFVATAASGKLQIQLLSHVSQSDEDQIRERLAGLPFKVSADRLTLSELEHQTGHHFPEQDDKARGRETDNGKASPAKSR